MATKSSSLRNHSIKRRRFTNDFSMYLILNRKTHKLFKKPKKVITTVYIFGWPKTRIDISRKHKIEVRLWDKIPKSSQFYYYLDSYLTFGVKTTLINDVFDSRSPINSRAIAVKHVMAKFYEVRDLTTSLNLRTEFNYDNKRSKI